MSSQCSPRCRRLVCIVLSLPILAMPIAAEAARPPAARLLPEKTALVATVVQVPELSKRFLNTSIGRMSQDPQLAPFVKHLYGSAVEAVAKLQDRIELGLPDLLALPQGEVTVALVAPEEEPPSLLVMIDTGDQLPNAMRLIKRGGEMAEKAGVKKTEQTVSGVKLTIYEGLGPRNQMAVWFEKDGTIVVGTSFIVAKQLIATWSGEQGRTLGDSSKYGVLVQRCRAIKDEEPQVLWYADPIALLRGFGKRNPGAQLVIALLPTLGLDGVQAVGGSIAFDAGQFDSIVHTHLFLDNPRSGVLQILAAQAGETRPERWVPEDVSTYVTLNWGVERSYRALAKVYDSIRGEGALAGEIQRRIGEPVGVDFAKEVLPLLEGRMTYLTRIEKPATARSGAFLLGFKLKDPGAMGKVLEKAYAKNEKSLTSSSAGEGRFYQVKPPAAAPGKEDQPRPAPCFGVVDDYLIIADRSSLYQLVISTRDSPQKLLADALDFKLVASKIARRSGGVQPAMIRFDRPEEQMRYFYDLAQARAGRDPSSRIGERNPFFRSLDAAMEANPLPPFEVLQRYLAPSGAMLLDDETGLHYINFTLRRK